MTQLRPEASPVCSRTRRWACHGSSGLYYVQALISPAGLGTEGWEDGEGVRVQTPVAKGGGLMSRVEFQTALE